MRIAVAADERTGVADAVVAGRAEQAVVCCWTGTVLALGLRTTSEAELAEILDAWFAGEPSPGDDDRANVDRVTEIESGA